MTTNTTEKQLEMLIVMYLACLAHYSLLLQQVYLHIKNGKLLDQGDLEQVLTETADSLTQTGKDIQSFLLNASGGPS